MALSRTTVTPREAPACKNQRSFFYLSSVELSLDRASHHCTNHGASHRGYFCPNVELSLHCPSGCELSQPEPATDCQIIACDQIIQIMEIYFHKWGSFLTEVGWSVGWLSARDKQGGCQIPTQRVRAHQLPRPIYQFRHWAPTGQSWGGQAGGTGALSGPPSGPMRVKLRNKGPSDLSRLFLTENRNEGKQEQISSAVMLLWKWRQRITQIHIIGKTTLYKSLLYSVCVMATFTQNLHSSVYDRLDYSQANTSTNNGLCKQDILHPGRISRGGYPEDRYRTLSDISGWCIIKYH